ncbi:MAG: hypothetical protein KIT11_00715 [Fimbriimonadaceae bacterium]|nr:hypothetical protein [Fimbriimonadaceae bacterium]QYK55105.1 MAG: hypothetical protein KF733_08820 [Fimbriimonadaceae bacterium]
MTILAASVLLWVMVAPTPQKYTFGFLVRGQNPPKLEKAEAERMQGEHLGNFGRLNELGKLVTAGPVQDPTQYRRGILVFVPATNEELAEWLKPDPYVQNGVMELDSFSIETEAGALHTEGIEPDKIEEFRLVYCLAGPHTPNEKIEAAHKSYLAEHGRGSGLAFWAKATETGPTRAVGFFVTKDDAAIYKFLAADPIVRQGCWTPVVVPQWLSPGILKAID